MMLTSRAVGGRLRTKPDVVIDAPALQFRRKAGREPDPGPAEPVQERYLGHRIEITSLVTAAIIMPVSVSHPTSTV